MNNLRKFNTEAEYSAATLVYPSVAWVVSEDTVHFDKTEPTPPSPKWLATYTGGTTSSAECDSTSAITQNEIELTDLESVVIGDCVTSIGQYAFKGCRSLTSCTIGSGITTIGQDIFSGCFSLASLTVKATTPPSLLGAGELDNLLGPIYVPSESVETYKAASGWSTYASRIQAIT